MARPACAAIDPELRPVADGHGARCIRLPGYWRGDERVPDGVDPTDPERESDE